MCASAFCHGRAKPGGCSISSTGITAVIIEHYMDVVFTHAARIVMMHQGRILADGIPEEIRRNEDAVNKIKEMGISPFIAESNLMTAAKVADRLYAIDRGEIIFTGH